MESGSEVESGDENDRKVNSSKRAEKKTRSSRRREKSVKKSGRKRREEESETGSVAESDQRGGDDADDNSHANGVLTDEKPEFVELAGAKEVKSKYSWYLNKLNALLLLQVVHWILACQVLCLWRSSCELSTQR